MVPQTPQTGETLAQKVRAKYPGVYDDLSDDELDKKVRAKYPGVYDDIPSTLPARMGGPGPNVGRPQIGGRGSRQSIDVDEPITTPNTFEKIDKFIKEPLTTAPSKFAKSISEYIDPNDPIKGRSTGGLRGYASAGIESLGDVLSGMTSPENLALMTIGAGEGMAAKAGSQLTPILTAARRISSAPSVGHGISNIASGNTTQGLVDIGLGGAGVLMPAPKINAEVPPSSNFAKAMELEDIISKPNLTTDEINRAQQLHGEIRPKTSERRLTPRTKPQVSDEDFIKSLREKFGIDDSTSINDLRQTIIKSPGAGNLSLADRGRLSRLVEERRSASRIGPSISDEDFINSVRDLVGDTSGVKSLTNLAIELNRLPQVPREMKSRLNTMIQKKILPSNLIEGPVIQGMNKNVLNPLSEELRISGQMKERGTGTIVNEGELPTPVKGTGSEFERRMQAKVEQNRNKPLLENKPLNEPLVTELNEGDALLKQVVGDANRQQLRELYPQLSANSRRELREFINQYGGERGVKEFFNKHPELDQRKSTRPFGGNKPPNEPPSEPPSSGGPPSSGDGQIPEPPPNANTFEKENLYQKVSGTIRSALTSMDLSALRQAKGFILHPEYWTNIKTLFKAWGDKNAVKSIRSSITNDESGFFKPRTSERGTPRKSIAEEAGLDLSDHSVSERWGSKFASKIPGIGASQRAFEGYILKMRADMFKKLYGRAESLGRGTPEVARQIADLVNTGTGTSRLGGLEKSKTAIKALNETFFAPRYNLSRVKMYTQVLNPKLYTTYDPIVRKEALKSLLGVVGTSTLIGELAKMAGAEVSNNPTSSDFRKIKIGKVRMDNLAGLQQYGVAASRLLSGESTSSVSGKTYDLANPKFGGQNRADVVTNFLTSKLAPIPSFVWGWMENKEFNGEPFDAKMAMVQRTVPIVMQDLYALYKEDPSLIPVFLIPMIAGEGTQVYGR